MPVVDLRLPCNPVKPCARVVLVGVILLLAGLTLAGCSRYAPEHIIGPATKVLAPQPDLCNLVSLTPLIGKDFVSLADQSLIGTLRVIWPGQEISAEVIATRLNAQVSDQGLIEQLFCG